MKTVLITLLFLCTFNSLEKAYGEEKRPIACSHSELCRLGEIILAENGVKGQKLVTLVHISGDPHEFEPSSSETKSLIKAPVLITGPMELNPWVKKINYQRSKIKDLTTFALSLTEAEYALYKNGAHSHNREALAHFWLYPKIFCALKTQLEQEFINARLFSEQKNKKDCRLLAEKMESDFKATLSATKIPVILTHDALLPLFESLKDKNGPAVVAIKGSGHHQEATALSVKKLYDALKAPKAIWILETGIHVPDNVLAKKRAGDITVSLDTANSKGLDYFFVLTNLKEQLNKAQQ